MLGYEFRECQKLWVVVVGLAYFVFYLLYRGGLRPTYRYGTKCNVARKLAKRNGAIINASFVGPTLDIVYPTM